MKVFVTQEAVIMFKDNKKLSCIMNFHVFVPISTILHMSNNMLGTHCLCICTQMTTTCSLYSFSRVWHHKSYVSERNIGITLTLSTWLYIPYLTHCVQALPAARAEGLGMRLPEPCNLLCMDIYTLILLLCRNGTDTSIMFVHLTANKSHKCSCYKLFCPPSYLILMSLHRRIPLIEQC